MYKLREISRGNYDDRGYSNEETIAHLMLQKPEEINNALTYTYGMDDDRFPLTFMTEGQGSVGVKDISTIQWTWKTMGRMKFDDCITKAPTDDKPGLGGTMFEIETKTHWFIEQYGLLGPDGMTQLRIMKDLGESANGYKYLVKLANPNPNAYVDKDLLEVGKYWSLTAPTIPESFSKGNRSNVMGPGKMTSQLELHRYSKIIAGNISNVIVTYQFKTKSGGTTNLWINEEMRQFDIQCRIMDEERLWISEYNRNERGEITLVDNENSQPIPHTSGMMEICREANYDTYGEVLTLHKIDRTIFDVLGKDTDTGTVDVVMFGGKGFIQDFDHAIRDEAKSQGFNDTLGDKTIGETEGGLSYGKYFKKYTTIDGHTITVKHLPFLDHGTAAEAAKKNGMVHPRTGLPMTSHQGMFIDMSSYNGERNVRKVRMKNQIYKVGILKGLTDIPASWGAVPTLSISTDVDMSSYDVKNSYGLQVNNSSKMFMLKCVL